MSSKNIYCFNRFSFSKFIYYYQPRMRTQPYKYAKFSFDMFLHYGDALFVDLWTLADHLTLVVISN